MSVLTAAVERADDLRPVGGVVLRADDDAGVIDPCQFVVDAARRTHVTA